ncbi:MAG: GNAT family N-acetyltransferase [Steroidobacter sp.]
MIRPYRNSDVDAVALLFTDSVHHLASNHYDADQRAAWAPRPPDLDSWTARLASLSTLVTEADMKLAGFISYEQNGRIDLLYTSPGHSRRGVASALYREAEAILAGSGVSELFTEASIVARPVFERFGFQVAEEQCVRLRGVLFRRYAMRKSLVAQQVLPDGACKTTRA